jgi:hypothetical protein
MIPTLLAEQSSLDWCLNATGFAVLITVFILFRGMIRRSRRRSLERIARLTGPPPLPVATTVQCPGCGTVSAEGARFCGRCGRPIWSPVMAPPAARRTSRVLLYLVIGLLGLIGLGAYAFWSLVATPHAAPPNRSVPHEIWRR